MHALSVPAHIRCAVFFAGFLLLVGFQPIFAQQIDTCNSQNVMGIETAQGVFVTACMLGDYGNNQFQGFAELENENELYYPEIGGEAKLYAGTTLIYDTGNEHNQGELQTSFVTNPVQGTTYTLDVTVDECYDTSGTGDSGDCTWYDDVAGQTVSVQLTWSPPSSWPTPPAGATAYSGLQTPYTSWSPAYGLATGSSGNDCGSYSISNATTPSLSGDSLELQNTNSSCTEWNVLAYRDLCNGNSGQDCSSTPPNNYELEVSFYIPPDYSYQAIEFDPDLTDPNGYTYKASVQCDSASGQWKYWDSSSSTWEEFGNNPTCALYNGSGWAGGWYRLRLYATMSTSGHSYTYEGLTLDTYSNGSYSDGSNLLFGETSSDACDGANNAACQTDGEAWPSRIWVEEQLDNSEVGTNVVYYDNYSLTVWNN